MNKDNSKTYRIGIDARFYGPVGKGLGRYTQKIVDNIIKWDKHNHYIIFLGPHNYHEFKTKQKNVEKVLLNIRWYTLKEQIMLPYYLYKYKLDLIHFTHFNIPLFIPSKFIVTIHDLILTKFPSLRATTLSPVWYKIKNLACKLVMTKAVKKSETVITVSNFTKQDILSQFQVDPDKIKITYEGVSGLYKNSESQSDDKKLLSSYNIDKKKYVLYVGNAYPHKNLAWLLQIWKDIKKKDKDLKLVLVGKEDYFYTRLKQTAINLGLVGTFSDSIVFLDYVEDKNLDTLYKHALAYIFPSLYEGFGLPPLEAMSRGCPVISSNQGSLPEILGPGAFYFNPYKTRDAKKRIRKFIYNPEFRNSFIPKAYKQIKKFSWDKCVSETYNIYMRALKT